MRESLLVSVLVALLAAVAADFSCSQAPDADIEKACEMMQEWDATARKEIRKRQLFGFGGGVSTGGLQSCRNLQCFCQMIGNRGGCGQRAYRREYRMLSDGERQRFHNALIALKQSGEYDRLSIMHRQVGTSSGAHSGPGFLPWHREYMKRMELAIRAIDPGLSLPYWDSVLDSYLPDPRDSIMFHPSFMGETDPSGQVIRGAFSNFRTLEGRPNIIRRLGSEGRLFSYKTPPQRGDINAVYAQNAIQNVLAYTAPQGGCPFPTNFQALEYTHSSVHLWIGGDMKPPTTSANDPIFFLHHTFVDLIWENWRQRRQSRAMRETQYPPDIGTCSNQQHFSYAAMRPWDMINREGLANYYTDNLFSYAPRPTCSAASPNCGSPYLFCDTRGNAHCVAKVKMSGRCNGFEGFDVCFQGLCQGGFCRPGNFGGTTSSFSAATTPFGTSRTSNFPTTPAPTTTRQQTAGAATTTRAQSTASSAFTTRGSTQAPAGGADANCFNDDPCCEPWARTGECRTNVAYMSRYCRRSCQYCSNPFDGLTGCVDRHQSCSTWRDQGYCTRRRQWMSENCQRSCGWCSQTKQQLCQLSVRRRL